MMSKRFWLGFIIAFIGKVVENSFNLPQFSLVVTFSVIFYALLRLWDKNKMGSE